MPFVLGGCPVSNHRNGDASRDRVDWRQSFDACQIEHGHAHRFRDTFAVRLLAQGASLYDVSKMLGIDMATAERHYSPYVKELQDRATSLIGGLSVPKSSHTPSGEKVLQFCSPLSATSGKNGEAEAKDTPVQYPDAVQAKS